jgi:hypothetical protein
MPRRAMLLAGLYLLLQLAAPLDYYLSDDDPSDERFSWRMFSAVHMMRCDLELRPGDGAPVDLESRFHGAWIELAQRGRRSVIEAMGRRVCEQGQPVALRLHCRQLDGRETTAAVSDYCSEGPPWKQRS